MIDTYCRPWLVAARALVMPTEHAMEVLQSCGCYSDLFSPFVNRWLGNRVQIRYCANLEWACTCCVYMYFWHTQVPLIPSPTLQFHHHRIWFPVPVWRVQLWQNDITTLSLQHNTDLRCYEWWWKNLTQGCHFQKTHFICNEKLNDWMRTPKKDCPSLLGNPALRLDVQMRSWMYTPSLHWVFIISNTAPLPSDWCGEHFQPQGRAASLTILLICRHVRLCLY